MTRTDSLEVRFRQRVTQEPNTGCWLWTGNTFPNGYGQISCGGRKLLTHRVSFELDRGSVPADKVVCHRCDVPLCVNPDHLFLGTQSDNVSDCYKKGRRPVGSLKSNALLTEEAVADIRTYRLTHKAFAALYGASEGSVRAAQIGKSWHHVKSGKKPRAGQIHSQGERHRDAKLNEDAVRDIRKRRMSLAAYGRLYGVTAQSVRSAMYRQTWTHVE
jgi:HNH endonuclease